MDFIALLKIVIELAVVASIIYIFKKAITAAMKKELDEALDVLEKLLREYKDAINENSEAGKKISDKERDRLLGLFVSLINEIYDVIKALRNSVNN